MASYVGMCGSEHCMLASFALMFTVCTVSDCVVGVLGFGIFSGGSSGKVFACAFRQLLVLPGVDDPRSLPRLVR